MFSRRDFLKVAALGGAALSHVPQMSLLTTSAQVAVETGANGALCCINIVNFIREIEPRFAMDMALPVPQQMERFYGCEWIRLITCESLDLQVAVRRNSSGDTPYSWRKEREKWAALLKPVSRAIWPTL